MTRSPAPAPDRVAAEARGRRAETIAALFLMAKGWKILDRRVRVAGGEIDLVARRGRVLAFVEVKQRKSREAADWSLDAWRLRRVAAAAEMLVPRFVRDGDEVRIDAIFIVPGHLPRHLANVWTG